MRWSFGDYTLDVQTAELSTVEGPVHVERQAFDVLAHLISNADRIVSRDELIEAVWDGRFVSDATVSTAIKLARRAVGDDGSTQAIVRTVHGRGFRFVAKLEEAIAPRAAEPAQTIPNEAEKPSDVAGAGRPSLAVLRFQSLGAEDVSAQIASALPAELISSLARVGWLHMIARGSSFRFDPDTTTPQAVAELLSVRYLVTGMVELVGELVTVTVELQSTEDGSLIWADRFATTLLDLQGKRADIVSEIISALELEIPRQESLSAQSLSVAQFDAWTHFHLGLSHIYRFNTGSNLIATQHFDAAIALDPEFARAHAGKSFVHWQNAFMQFGDDRARLISEARREADVALAIDPREPFAAFNVARVKWLEGDFEEGVVWLDRALTINPNYAQSHYNRALIQTLSGVADEGAEGARTALRLSPLDPLAYGMYSAQAMSAMMRDEHEEAARFAERGNQEPSAHYFVHLIAALANEMAGNTATAQRWVSRARKMRPDVSAGAFFQSFPFRLEADRKKILSSFGRLGLD